jgi:hypothetical protein
LSTGHFGCSTAWEQNTIIFFSGTNKLYHIMLYRAQLAWAVFELATFIMMGTDCIGSCKPKYHTITNTTAPLRVCSIQHYVIKFVSDLRYVCGYLHQ